MIEEEIESYLQDKNVVWKIKGGQEIDPTQKDIRTAIDRAKESLYNDGVGSLVTFAGLLVYKTENGYDVYVLAGKED